jgi:hypothetical protein
MSVEDLRVLLASRRFRYDSELQLQDGIASVLAEAKVDFQREVELGRRDRIDFLVAPRIGVEVKVKSGVSELTRQLHRYAQSSDIDCLMLVSSSLRLCHAIPRELNGKRVVACALNGGGIL